MPDEMDWSVTTFEGNRRRQHEEFRALSFREKLMRVEQMSAVVEFFLSRRDREQPHGAPGADVRDADLESRHERIQT